MHGILPPTFAFINHTRHHAKSNGISLHEKNAIRMRQTGCAHALEAPTCKVLDAERIPTKLQIAIEGHNRFRGLRNAIAYPGWILEGSRNFRDITQMCTFMKGNASAEPRPRSPQYSDCNAHITRSKRKPFAASRKCITTPTSWNNGS
jgi:hypothetical protein